MTLFEPGYLLDVNVLVALHSENHICHQLVTNWFNTRDLQWFLCPFTVAGFLRNAIVHLGGTEYSERMLALRGE